MYMHTQTQAFINHATWPHYGPGNSMKQDRYVLFYVFSLDDAGARHTTAEEVIRYV